MPPRTAVARARSNARRSSKRDRASARRGSAPWTGSVPRPAQAPARNVRLPRSLQNTLFGLRRILLRLRRALLGLWRARGSLDARGFCVVVRLCAVIVFPVPLFLQRIRDILGHVGLVVLGEHGVGLEHT